ncbi:hypothetical protein BDL97_14G058700 [Sphagnum fallax]|nr:hypothetical protein BDL97_14G058700 [Sphagnum fallax]
METVEHKMLLARMQALVTCNSALRIVVSLYSLRSEIISEKPTEDAITDSERYERLVGAIEVLQADLQAERQKVQQLARHVYTDLARLLLFLAGILCVIAFFQYTELPTSTCRKKYT